MIKSIICGLSLMGIALSETKDCNCSDKSPSRAAEVLGEKKLTFAVEGMRCGRCVANLTKKLKTLENVISVDLVDHQEKSVKLTVKPDACEAKIKQAITEAGYSVKEG